MAKKAKISQLYNPASMASMIAQATGQTAAQSEPKEPVFEVVEVLPKIKKATKAEKEKKTRNITKPIGRPVKFTGEVKRRVVTTMMRLNFIAEIEKMTGKGKTFADVLDKILEERFK